MESAVRRDISAVVLRKKARAETDGDVVARLFGIANIVHAGSEKLEQSAKFAASGAVVCKK